MVWTANGRRPLGGEMASSRAHDPIGPFGNPDGSRAEIEDVLHDFVDFGGDPAFGGLATRANDSTVRVIVGKLGAGKTVYMRRLQDFQSRQDSVYADVPQQNLPRTEVIVKACHWFNQPVLVEKWMQIWERAVLRSLASHLLRNPDLRAQLSPEDVAELEAYSPRLLDEVRRPRTIYSQVRDMINQRNTAHQLSTYLDDPQWDDLEEVLAQVLRRCKPVYFYLDAVDEEFGHAPMYWLKCQEGLFYQVMRLLRDPRFGGRLHVVVCIRDIVMSSVYRTEHAPRYYNEPHIRVLTWDRSSLTYFLRQKVRGLPPSLLMRHRAGQPPDVGDWLGIATENPADVQKLEQYLLDHTRLIPRDVISIGNDMCEEILRRKRAGSSSLSMEVVDQVLARSAKRFGDSQLAQCANQVSSDLMPRQAVQRRFSEVYLSNEAYSQGIEDDLRQLVRAIGVDEFRRKDLDAVKEMASVHFEDATDLVSVLWQNGLLGYIDDAGARRFYSLGDVEQFHLPMHQETFVLHPCLVHTVGGIERLTPTLFGGGA